MILPRWLVLLFLLFCPALVSQGGGNKGATTGISFHLQGDASDNPKMIFPQLTNGQNLVYRRVPDFSIRDVAAYNPFPSRDGEGFGATLQLKPGAKNRLSALTNANSRRWMLAMVNGRAVDAVLIDKQVDDGYLVIWKGIGAAEIAAFDKEIPRFGETKPSR